MTDGRAVVEVKRRRYARNRGVVGGDCAGDQSPSEACGWWMRLDALEA
jgi:hypothetical protein